MKRQSILFILLLLLTLFSCQGCSGSESAMPPTPAKNTREAAPEGLPEEGLEDIEDVSGIFEGLEDNHTALFSFDGVEIAFFFEDDTVQNVLSEAVMGSTYQLSYYYDTTLGLNVISKISE